MPETIDSLQIEISSSSQTAQKGIDALSASLEKLKTATKGGAGLTSLTKKLNALSETFGRTTPASATALKKFGEALGTFKGAENIKISSTIGKQISEIAAAAEAISGDRITSLTQLGSAVGSLSSIREVKISSTIAKGISEIAAATNVINLSDLSRIGELSSAIASLAAIKNIQISSTIANRILDLGIAAEQLTGIDFSIFGNLAEALHPLSTIENPENMASTIQELNKLPGVISSLAVSDLTGFKTKIQEIAQALSSLPAQTSSVLSGLSQISSNAQTAAQSTMLLTQSNASAAGSYTDLYSRIRVAASAVQKIANTIAGWIKSSNEYIEDVNLFTASLGQYAQKAQEYAEKVADLVGIDPGEWMRAQGIFYNLADGFGVASDRAYTMSQQLTQLSYDLASFYNIQVEDAMLKVRGGLSGEIEMMRQLGVDLSNAAMQERATAMGIDTKVTAMTQAEKAQLRYLLMMERTTVAQGDMARTLSSPSNQLRVLTAQLNQAGRALGNAFIPMLNAVLPYLIAVAKAIRILASAVAALFGYSLPTVDYSGISDSIGSAAGGASDLADGLGSASDNAKKLKSYLMGFDELNVINPPDDSDSSGSGSGGAGGGGGGFDWDLPTYDFLDGLISTRVDEIMEKLEPVLNFIQEHMDEILAIAGAITAELLLWKVAKSLIPDLRTIRGDLKEILSAVVAGAVIVITAQLVYEFDNKFMETGKWGFLIADGLSTALGAYISGKVIANAFGKQKGLYTASVAITVSAATTLKVIYDRVVQEGWSANALTADIWAIIKGAFAGGLFALAAGTSVVSGAVVGATITLAAAVILTLSAFETRQTLTEKALAWGKMTLTAAEIKKQAEKLFTIDVPVTVKLIETQIENEEQARTDLETAITNFNANVKKIEIGAEISAGDVDSMVSQLTGEGGVISKLQSLIDEEKATVELAVSLVPPTSSDGEDLSANLLNAMGLGSETLAQTAASIGEGLSSAMQEGLITGFSNGEGAVINELTKWLNDISTAVSRGQVEGGFLADTKILLTDANRESFSGVLDSYKALEKELKESYEALEKQALQDAVAYEAGLEKARDYYRSIGDEVNAAKAQEALTQISRQIENWDIDGSVQKAVDASTVSGRQSVLSAMQKIFEPASNEISQSRMMQTFFKSWMNSDAFEIESQSIESLANSFQTKFLDAFDANLTAEDRKVVLQAKEVLGINEWDVLGADVQTQFYNSLSEAFGASTAQGILSKLGYSMSGIIAQGIADGTMEIASASENMITVVGETVGEKTMELTPELEEIFKTFGIDLSDYISTGIEEGSPKAADAAEGLANQVIDATATSFEQASGETMEIAKNSGMDAGNAYVDACATELENGESSITAGAKTAVSGVNDVMESVDTTANEKLNQVIDKADTTSETVDETMNETFKALTDAASASFSEIDTSAETTLSGLASWVEINVTSPIAKDFGSLATNIQTALAAVKTNVQSAWNEIPGWFTSNVKTPTSATFSLLQTEIETGMTTAKTNTQTVWSQVSAWFSSNVVQPMMALFKAGCQEITRSFEGTGNDVSVAMESMGDRVSRAFETAKASAKSAWEDMPSYMSQIASQMASSLADAGWQSAGYWAAQDFKEGFESVQIRANVSSSTGSVSAYASGGFPRTGEVFVAREAGAEMVGRIRGKTAVANNDQIVEGVSEGVYSAVTAALSENTANANVTVYLDGKVVYQNQQKVAKTVGYQFAH